MKKIVALTALLLTFALNSQVLANDEHATEKTDKKDVLCTAEQPEKCTDESHGAKAHTYNKDWTHKRLEQVAAILPQPVADKEQSNKPAQAQLTSPKFLAQINGTDVKLEWTAAERAKSYHIQVSKDAGFNNRSMMVANEQGIKATSFEVKNLEPNTKYFWRVAAYNETLLPGFSKSNFVSSEFSTH